MADNTTRKNAAGTSEGVAADRVTYSGDADQALALHRPVHVTGAEGSKTVVDITDSNGAFVQGPVAHDVAGAGNPVLMGGRASAAAPSDVAADNRAVRAWLLRNGAQAIVITAGGALVGGDATNGVDVDVTRTGEGIADDAGFTVGTSRVIPSGLQAVAHGSNPDAADALDAVVALANRHRVQFVIGGHPNAVTFSTRIPAASGAQTDLAIGPGTVSAGTKVVVTRLSITCSNANTVNVAVKVGFGASTIPADTATATGSAGILIDHEGVPPGGGFMIGDGAGILGVGADGEELRFTCDSPTSGHVIVSGTYYTIES